MNPVYSQWLISHGMQEWVGGLPQLGSATCQMYLNTQEGQYPRCDPGCPFKIECDPYFESLNKEFERKFGLVL
jgi:hypothetical protein